MAHSIKYAKRLPLPFGIPAPTLTLLECHFEFEPPADQADVFACLFRSEPVPNWKSYEGSTRLIDLHCEPDLLFAGLPKGTRYEINRATKKDRVDVSFFSSPTDERLDEFMNYYDEFAVSKGVPRMNRPQLRALRAAEKAALSFARTTGGAILASHAYILSGARARLTHSASLFRLERKSSERGQIGRANRLLHWNDLVTLRDMGVACYDFGGWYEGSQNEALVRINAFKKEFGGEAVREWSSFDAGSTLGSLYLAARDLMLRRKH
jgi:hypothetical protein